MRVACRGGLRHPARSRAAGAVSHAAARRGACILARGVSVCVRPLRWGGLHSLASQACLQRAVSEVDYARALSERREAGARQGGACACAPTARAAAAPDTRHSRAMTRRSHTMSHSQPLHKRTHTHTHHSRTSHYSTLTQNRGDARACALRGSASVVPAKRPEVTPVRAGSDGGGGGDAGAELGHQQRDILGTMLTNSDASSQARVRRRVGPRAWRCCSRSARACRTSRHAVRRPPATAGSRAPS